MLTVVLYFFKLGILNVIDMHNCYIAVFMFSCFNGNLPTFLLTCFNLNCDVHNFNTRNALNYNLPKIRTTCMKNSLFFKGPLIWISIPQEIKKCKTVNLFKIKYKKIMLNKYNNHY